MLPWETFSNPDCLWLLFHPDLQGAAITQWPRMVAQPPKSSSGSLYIAHQGLLTPGLDCTLLCTLHLPKVRVRDRLFHLFFPLASSVTTAHDGDLFWPLSHSWPHVVSDAYFLPKSQDRVCNGDSRRIPVPGPNLPNCEWTFQMV